MDEYEKEKPVLSWEFEPENIVNVFELHMINQTNLKKGFRFETKTSIGFFWAKNTKEAKERTETLLKNSKKH